MSRAGRRRGPAWSRLSDEQLLDLRLCDLHLRIRGSRIEPQIRRLERELAARGLAFRPHCWIAQEWFSPDGVPGIAIPFYLLHPRLMALERRCMGEVEGGKTAALMQILRHEAGHALDTAFRLRRRRRWRELFGRASRPYPRHYRPRPGSRRFVQHLGSWYAQSHPTEDFAETVAVWLAPRSNWRLRYAGWPALRKLEYVDELIGELRGRRPPVRARRHVEPLKVARRTLRQHYAHMVRHYRSDDAERIDKILLRVFMPQRRRRGQTPAARLLREDLPVLRRRIAARTGASEYLVQELVAHLRERCRTLGLFVRGGRRRSRRRAERLIVALVSRARHNVGPWFAL
ncbi:MAG: hypothetical protein FJ191_03170 [Gammaproteobacteria bacterium]|nr:hypothetical protein [Gammaproteobacteria bacterium]